MPARKTPLMPSEGQAIVSWVKFNDFVIIFKGPLSPVARSHAMFFWLQYRGAHGFGVVVPHGFAPAARLTKTSGHVRENLTIPVIYRESRYI